MFFCVARTALRFFRLLSIAAGVHGNRSSSPNTQRLAQILIILPFEVALNSSTAARAATWAYSHNLEVAYTWVGSCAGPACTR